LEFVVSDGYGPPGSSGQRISVVVFFNVVDVVTIGVVVVSVVVSVPPDDDSAR
jgi:hypothetical protein